MKNNLKLSVEDIRNNVQQFTNKQIRDYIGHKVYDFIKKNDIICDYRIRLVENGFELLSNEDKARILQGTHLFDLSTGYINTYGYIGWATFYEFIKLDNLIRGK